MILHDFSCPNPDCAREFQELTTWNEETRSPNPVPCPSCSTPSPRVFRPRGWHHAVIAPGERTVYDYNPLTGDVKIPGRADVPIHPKRAAMGYERRECQTVQDVVRLERMTRRISERLNYDSGSSTRRPDGIDVD